MHAFLFLFAILIAGCSKEGGPGSFASSADKPATSNEMIVVEGEIVAESREVGVLAGEVRAWTVGVGGRLFNDHVVGSAERATSATLTLRIPPDRVDEFTVWLDERAVIINRQIRGEDVTKQYRDREIKLRNLEVTLERLEQLMGREDASLEEILSVEREITRVRGEIELLMGLQRHLSDRVAWATVDVKLYSTAPAMLRPTAKLYPGPHMRSWMALDGDTPSPSLGAGVTVHFDRKFTVDGAFFPGDTAFIGTLGFAAFSDFLGHGERKFFNPYLGLRTGGAYLDQRGHWVVGTDVGIELVKTESLLAEIWLRPSLLVRGDGLIPGIDAGAGFVFPF